LGLFPASASAQRIDGQAFYVKIKERFQYAGTELYSEAGVVERVVGERGDKYILQAPGSTIVVIPKDLVVPVSPEVAAQALLAEREKTMTIVAGAFKQLNAERLAAIQALAAAQKGGAVNGGVGVAPAVIETKIDGEFEGWDGDTVFKLANGQIWKQTEYAYTYRYAFRPDVLIYRSQAGKWMMKVDRIERAIGVERIK
jgi:hypothetical protein